jgi:hypothetical protein
MSGEPRRTLTKTQTELIAYLFGARHSLLTAKAAVWIADSARFAAFASRFRDKIRKKARSAAGSTAETDLLYELGVAYLLLQEKRFELTYEPVAVGKERGPDFAVTFRTNLIFKVEVTHLRNLTAQKIGGDLIDLRLIDILCSKLRQMAANMANLLVVVSNAALLDKLDMATQIAWIKEKAEGRDKQFFARQKFADPSDFFKYFERLSAVTVYSPEHRSVPSFWQNPQARNKLTEAVKTVLQRATASNI